MKNLTFIVLALMASPVSSHTIDLTQEPTNQIVQESEYGQKISKLLDDFFEQIIAGDSKTGKEAREMEINASDISVEYEYFDRSLLNQIYYQVNDVQDKREIVGFYDPDSNKIYLTDDLDLDRPQGRSTVFHEAFHVVQYAAERQKKVHCKASLEGEAYAEQSYYLEDNGVTMDNDDFVTTIKWYSVVLGACNPHNR